MGRVAAKCILAAGSLLLLLAGTAFGQMGAIQGKVTDRSGGAVPEASIKIENQKTGVQATNVTNAQGVFLAPYLIPGEYRLTVEKPGFEKSVTSDIRLSVQQTIDLDISLKVGVPPDCRRAIRSGATSPRTSRRKAAPGAR